MQKIAVLFVKTELLLHEHEYNAMRNLFQKIDDDTLEMYSSLDGFSEKDGIVINSPKKSKTVLELISEKINSGYILLSITELKKYLNLM